MNRASDAATNPPQIVCKCGRDHRRADSRQCPVFNILNDMNIRIRQFLDYQRVLAFGKNGPMAQCLHSVVLERYDNMIKEFKKIEATIGKHPEWQLADEIARLRRYFEQVADGCSEAKKAGDLRPPPSVVPHIASNEEEMLRNAKLKVEELYDKCEYTITQFLHNGVPSGRYHEHAEEYLPNVDNYFKETFEAIIRLLPGIENETIKNLTEKSYEIWKETRRLLCEFDFHGW